MLAERSLVFGGVLHASGMKEFFIVVAILEVYMAHSLTGHHMNWLHTCVSAVTVCTAAVELKLQPESSTAWPPSGQSSNMISQEK